MVLKVKGAHVLRLTLDGSLQVAYAFRLGVLIIRPYFHRLL